MGITNQRETVVVFDRKTGTPIHRAIVWQDRRTADALAEMASAEARVRELTGLPLDPYFSAAKIAWILDAVSGARAAAERGELGACTVDAWLVYKLTGGVVFATEPSNASRTSLFDLRQGDWSDELLTLFRVPRACLPEIRDSAGDFGVVEATGWPIRGVVGDQQAALFGQGCIAPGEAKCTFGTGAFMLYACGETLPKPSSGLLGTVAGMIKAFAQIQNKQGLVNPSDLAEGISNALVTTAAGLTVAIPTLVVYNYFVTRVDNMVLEMEISSSELVELLTQDRGELEI